MGLIKELDDQIGRLLSYLRESNQLDDTMIVFCSDHGDNLGDHWMGEKDLFYDCSAKVPLIVYDPRDAASKTRGTTVDALVEGIDLVPTFIEFFGGVPKTHVLEGRSLQPWLHNSNGPGPSEADWRQYCVSEYDYATRDARRAIGVDQADARLVMVFDGRWKYVHVEHMRPMLFDLQSDPQELVDLGDDVAHKEQIERLSALHFEWTRQHHTRVTRSASIIESMTDDREPPGIIIGYANSDELKADGLKLPGHVKR